MPRVQADFRVTEEEAGERLDRVLAARLPGASRSRVASWIERGFARVNEVPAAKSERVSAGDRVVLEAPDVADPDSAPAAEAIPLDVLYEDEHLAVVEKPAGMPTHTGPGHAGGTLVNALLGRYPEIATVGSAKRPGIVHRLDRGTSGLLVVARTDAAYRGLVDLVSSRALKREYWALAAGRVQPTRGVIEAPIGRDPKNRFRFALREDGKPARTRFRVLARGERATEVAVELETGRTHQIRVHFAAIDHPLLGDPLYGKPFPGLFRQALHARRIAFRHPVTGVPVEVDSPLPEDLAAARRAAIGSAAEGE